MVNMPVTSVMAVWTAPPAAVLRTSTVTPGSTAPVASLTVPLMVPSSWALTLGASASAARTAQVIMTVDCRRD